MMPGGVTEAIWHFSGYLHLITDIARDRIALDEGVYRAQTDDYTAKLPQFETPSSEDDVNPAPVPPPPPLLAPVSSPHLGPIKHVPPAADHEPDDLAPPRLHGYLPQMPWGDGASGSSFVITVTREPGGDQGQMEIHQINAMDNDNTLVVSPSPELTALLAQETGHLLDDMIGNVDHALPPAWNMPLGTSAVATFVSAHDQAWSGGGGQPDAHSVTPGDYVNGVLQDPALPPPDQAPLPTPWEPPTLPHTMGQWAFDGGNTSINAADIVDLTSSARTMIVLGNYYSTDAIFQTNSYVNNDHITIAGGQTPSITTGGDQAINIADFVQHDGVYATLPSYFAGPHWSIDVVNGDYYNVSTLVQTNYLSNNNITVQQSWDTQYEVQAGGNQQENLAQIHNGGFSYDLIVVNGSFNSMNVIFQNNILLNNNIIKMAGDGTHPSQTVDTGGNQLTNSATIENYGGNNFEPFSASLQGLVNAVASGATELDPALGNLIAGDGGTFHVLYVTGNYYDINALWQTNVIANNNVALQLLEPPSAGPLSFYGTGAETQSVSTGNNILANDAAIINVLPTTASVAGQVYGDTILFQANLVSQNNDHVTQANPQTLVPELIAFIGEAEAPPAAHTQPVTTMPIHEDPFASMTH
ncbi:MAG: hypothetical protein AB1586_29030 [Pseudomonadota bacterium]